MYNVWYISIKYTERVRADKFSQSITQTYTHTVHRGRGPDYILATTLFRIRIAQYPFRLLTFLSAGNPDFVSILASVEQIPEMSLEAGAVAVEIHRVVGDHFEEEQVIVALQAD
jgi:hypothetical protein